MQMVRHRDAVTALSFDEQRRLGNHALDGALGLLVAWPVTFVTKQKAGVAQMSIEFSGKVIGVRNVRRMLAEQLHQAVAESALAGAAFTFQHKRNLCSPIRMLHQPS